MKCCEYSHDRLECIRALLKAVRAINSLL
jgi:hypothetical protein